MKKKTAPQVAYCRAVPACTHLHLTLCTCGQQGGRRLHPAKLAGQVQGCGTNLVLHVNGGSCGGVWWRVVWCGVVAWRGVWSTVKTMPR